MLQLQNSYCSCVVFGHEQHWLAIQMSIQQVAGPCCGESEHRLQMRCLLLPAAVCATTTTIIIWLMMQGVI